MKGTPLNRGAASGYTLLETVVSMALLVTIAVPLVSHLYRGFLLANSERECVGMWLCEQEAAIVQTFPSQSLPVRRRQIRGEEWTIRTDKQGGNPLHYQITAHLRSKEHALVHFYGRAADVNK